MDSSLPGSTVHGIFQALWETVKDTPVHYCQSSLQGNAWRAALRARDLAPGQQQQQQKPYYIIVRDMSHQLPYDGRSPETKGGTHTC